MIKSKFALIIDSFILSLISSFLIFIWFRNYFKNANLFRFFLILIIILCFVLFFKLFSKSNNNKSLKLNNNKFLNSCLNHLTICPFSDYKNFIIKLISCEYIDGFLFKLSNSYLYINLKTELSPNDYFLAQEEFFNHTNKDSKLYFIYKTKSKSFDEILELSKLDITLLDSSIITKLMTTKNIFPIEKASQKKQSFKQRFLKNLKTKTQGITNRHFKELFFSGLSLSFLSLIVPFSKLYLISGSILLVISIITLFKKNYKIKTHDSDFLFK